MTLGDLVKKYRESNNISMDEFSKKSGLSKGYISMLENNINPRNNKPIAPTLPTIKKIACAMNMDVDTILKTLDSNQEINLDDISEKRSYVEYGIRLPKIMEYYNELNDFGQHEATKRVEELTHIEKYTVKENLLPNAAHESTDIEITEEMLQYDEDIMDDENF